MRYVAALADVTHAAWTSDVAPHGFLDASRSWYHRRWRALIWNVADEHFPQQSCRVLDWYTPASICR